MCWKLTQRRGRLVVGSQRRRPSRATPARTKLIEMYWTHGPPALKRPGQNNNTEKEKEKKNIQGTFSRQSAGNFPGWQYNGLQKQNKQKNHLFWRVADRELKRRSVRQTVIQVLRAHSAECLKETARRRVARRTPALLVVTALLSVFDRSAVSI